MPMLTDLAQALRAYTAPDGSKLKVVETDGWASRGYAGQGLTAVAGHMWHHTATATSAFQYSDCPTLSLLINGRSDLPGPLCNIAFGRSGTVYVVAAGVANHAGTGSAGGAYTNVGNHYFIGNEMESSGTSDDWTEAQRRIMPHVGAALESWYGDASFIQMAHREYSDMGKIDPAYVDMDVMRAEITSILYGGGGSSSSAVVESAETRQILPVTGYAVTQNFGDGATLSSNLGGGHTGIDFGCPAGTSAVALEAGTVLWADWASNLPTTSWADRWFLVGGGYGGLATDAGIVVVLQHKGYVATYSHLHETPLNIGDKVVQGQEIGKTGYTGYTYARETGFGYNQPAGAHLHFEVLPEPFDWSNDYYGRTDPRPYFIQTIETTGKTASTGKDWLEMASKEDVKNALREVLAEPIKREGGEAGSTSIIAEAAWRTARDNRLEKRLDVIGGRVFHLWTDFHLGVAGRVFDSPFMNRLRRHFGFALDEAKRAEDFKAAEKKGWL